MGGTYVDPMYPYQTGHNPNFPWHPNVPWHAEHLALFEGLDSSGQHGLWVTNGRAAGTHELTGITGASPTLGLSPVDLTVFNGKVLFGGLIRAA
jgi:hypothetical protein